MANPWLTVALASPLNPTAPAGNLSRPPPLPDPPDPDLFPPLSSSRSAPSKASRRLSHTAPSTSASTVYLPSSTPITTDLARPPPALSNTTSPLPISSTAQLLAYYTVTLPSASNPNPFSPPAHPVSSLPTQPPSTHNPGILPSPYPIFSSATPFPPVTDNTVPFNTIPNPSHQTAPPKTSISWNADPAGTFVLGLAAVFKDRPIITSNSFSALPPSDNHTATNPFTLPKPLTSADLSKPPDAIPEPSEPSVVNQSLTPTPPFTVISPQHHTDPFVFGSIPQPFEASTPSTLAPIPSPTQEEEPSI
ncbi:BnaC05g32890D [Brassica napus]|uniref:BnaC05g32890D protein n=2 Tax=Brassica napus TaxID=3708 RepID=A0A078GDL2_BRANA|nr:BnaC05g32890D [Brassica napus]